MTWRRWWRAHQGMLLGALPFIWSEHLWLPRCHRANRSELPVSQFRQLVSWTFESSFMCLRVASIFPREVRGKHRPPMAPLAPVTLCRHAQPDGTLQSPFLCEQRLPPRSPGGRAAPLPPQDPNPLTHGPHPQGRLLRLSRADPPVLKERCSAPNSLSWGLRGGRAGVGVGAACHPLATVGITAHTFLELPVGPSDYPLVWGSLV